MAQAYGGLLLFLAIQSLPFHTSNAYAVDEKSTDDRPLAQTADAACRETLGDTHQASSSKTVIQESEELTALLRSVQDGYREGLPPPITIEPTPLNREVHFYVSNGSGSSRYEGRIVQEVDGVIIFKRKDYNGAYSTKIDLVPISAIALNDRASAAVVKILTPTERLSTIALLEEAVRTGSFIRYVSQSGRRTQTGRIVSVDKNLQREATSFVLAEDNGSEISHGINSVDPGSIQLFKVTPRTLTTTESALLSQLQAAHTNRRYVSFEIDTRSNRIVFEGWVTGIELTTAGEYRVKIDPNGHAGNWDSQSYKLTSIVAESFTDNPQLRPHDPAPSGNLTTGVKMRGFIDHPSASPSQRRRPGPATEEVSNLTPLFDELSAFADSTQASGIEVPPSLRTLLPPGAELRLYFIYGQRSIRLTIRRNAAGVTFFGDTAFDRNAVDESFRDDRSHSRYTINEEDRLTSQRFGQRLPAAALREHLRFIRMQLLNAAIEAEFHADLVIWRKSIPEKIRDAEVQKLFLFDHDKSFHLNRGVVSDAQPALSEGQAKMLAAIHYLIERKMVFWSTNANSSNVNSGIYPQDTLKIKTLYLAGYDFSTQLFESMDNADLLYIDGRWISKN